MDNSLNTALKGLNDSFHRLDKAAVSMTPNNPDGFEKPLLDTHLASKQAQSNLVVVKHWNENIGHLLDTLA